eukprot:TRINITY_DN57628_c0_g1_i1.p1 TRINITY_DN57628_c0_g1~~TRINITY_DN57628_c0_g1_i1.p1  ORF type:complete len:297 (-),score=-13.76 TRINITY_DN57628_c0_g1_i1:36-926(-)
MLPKEFLNASGERSEADIIKRYGSTSRILWKLWRIWNRALSLFSRRRRKGYRITVYQFFKLMRWVRTGETQFRLKHLGIRQSSRIRSQFIRILFPHMFRFVYLQNQSKFDSEYLFLDGTHCAHHPVKGEVPGKRGKDAECGWYGLSPKLHQSAISHQIVSMWDGFILWVESFPGNCDDHSCFMASNLPTLATKHGNRYLVDAGYVNCGDSYVISPATLREMEKDPDVELDLLLEWKNLLKERSRLERLNHIVKVWGSFKRSWISIHLQRQLVWLISWLANEAREEHPLSWWEHQLR